MLDYRLRKFENLENLEEKQLLMALDIQDNKLKAKMISGYKPKCRIIRASYCPGL